MSKLESVTIERLIDEIKSYMASPNIELILRAFNYAKEMHSGQKRESGQPYIVHPLEVAYILATMRVDIESILAGLLHDVIEDTPSSYKEVAEIFGETVALLVEGVTKLDKIEFSSKEEQQAENLRKMFLAMARDLRVIIIKLADRLHNMRTLQSMPVKKQLLKAHETLSVFTPIANRLGISSIRMELEDLALRYLDSVAYYEIVEGLKKKKSERDEYISGIITEIRGKMEKSGITAVVSGRAKHVYSIFKKMYTQNKSIDEIYDLFAVRIIVDTTEDCYACLGMVHEMYRPIPGRFKDYIATPKTNNYQSLHSTVVGGDGQPFEIQIRTHDMHETAEHGFAAHWKYKEGDVNRKRDGEEKLEWLRKLLETQHEAVDPEDFINNLKVELFVEEVFVFTPQGDVVCLPADATIIDFAFAIHSQLGYRMSGGKVNGGIVPLNHPLKNCDVVEILTSATVTGPRRDWLNIVKTASARAKIRNWFKKEAREENIARGKDDVNTRMKKQNLTHGQLFKPEYLEPTLRRYGFTTVDDMYAAIGYGGLTADKIVARLFECYREDKKKHEMMDGIGALIGQPHEKKPPSGNTIIVKGIENCLTRMSRCCTPLPGDEIVGYITKGRGVTVHRKDCININFEPDDEEQNARLIECEWRAGISESYLTEVQIEFTDRTGILAEIIVAISDFKIPVRDVEARSHKGSTASAAVAIEISGVEQMERVIKRLLSIAGVFEVHRV